MLELPTRTQGGLLAIDDTSNGLTHVALERPRVARRADGTSRLRLVRWTSTNGGGPATPGGRLTLDIETFPTAAELRAAGFAPETTPPFPWLDAVVRIEGPQFEPVEALASIALGTAASVAVDLVPSAAAVLAPLLKDGLVPLQVSWSGHVLVRLPPVEVTATADIREVRRRLETVHGDRQSVVTRSVMDANARIDIHAANNAALEQALRDWTLDELTDRLRRNQPLHVRASASDVVRWPIQLSTSLDGISAGTGAHALVETVLLDEIGFGRTPPIEVRAVADFSGGLERVDVNLAALDDSHSQDLALLDDGPAVVRLGAVDFRWRRRTKLKDRPVSKWSEWETARGTSSLLIPVQLANAVRIEVLAFGLDFEKRWASVQLTLAHEVPGEPADPDAIELTAGQTTATWTKAVNGVRGTVTARARFTSRQGQVVQQSFDAVTGDQLVVADPLGNARVAVALVPAGTGWPGVAMAMVDLRYADGAHSVEETVALRSLDDFVEWEAPARADGPQVVSWRLHVSFRDGRYQATPWQDAPAGAIVVRVDAAASRDVQILPVYFDPTVTKKGTLRLSSGSRVESVTITDRAARTLNLPPGPFSWTIAWTAASGAELTESQAVEGDDVIVVPRFEAR